MLTRRDTSSFDPVNGELVSVESTQLLVGLLKSPKTFRGNTGFDQTLEDASRLGRAKVFYCAAYGLQFRPQVADLVLINSVSFKIHAVTTLEPGGLPITHTLTLLQE